MTKLLAHLRRSLIVNKFKTVYEAKTILKDMKLIVLYFSSIRDASIEHEQLLRKLIELHKTARRNGVRLEVIFVPVDICEEDANRCFQKQGDWYALPYGTDTVAEFVYAFGVTSTPFIITIKRDGTTVSSSASADINHYGTDAIVSWL